MAEIPNPKEVIMELAAKLVAHPDAARGYRKMAEVHRRAGLSQLRFADDYDALADELDRLPQITAEQLEGKA